MAAAAAAMKKTKSGAKPFSFDFFLVDVQKHTKIHNAIVLIGKRWSNTLKEFTKSSAVVITQIPHVLYARFRKESSEQDARDDLEGLMMERGLYKDALGDSLCMERVTRSVWLDEEEPCSKNDCFLRITYPGDKQLITLSSDREREHITRIYGAHSDAEERFIVEKNLFGTCYLRVVGASKAESSKQTLCEEEWRVSSWQSVVSMSEIPLTATHIDRAEPPLLACVFRPMFLSCAELQSQILVAYYIELFQFIPKEGTLVPYDPPPIDERDEDQSEAWPVGRRMFDSYKVFESTQSVLRDEKQLLERLARTMKSIDADIIIGHDFLQNTLPLLLSRMSAHRTRDWRVFGRFAMTKNDYRVHNAVRGRYMCDVKRFCEENSFAGYNTLSLHELATKYLEEEDKCVLSRLCETMRQMDCNYFLNQRMRSVLALRMQEEARTCMRVCQKAKILPLTLEICKICGPPVSVSFIKGKSVLTEWFYLHVFHCSQWIAPPPKMCASHLAKRRERSDTSNEQLQLRTKGDVGFQGGFVVETKSGIYSNEIIMLLDFAQMYPSLIIEHELCFSQDPDDQILPALMQNLIDMRQQSKGASQHAGDANDIRQLALKLTSNASGFGALGMPSSRFACKRVAERITGLGRELTKRCVEVVNAAGYEVPFGDTDSVAVRTGICSTDADAKERMKEIELLLVSKINALSEYGHMHVKVDSVADCAFLHTKKKYALRKMGTEREFEVKGLETVRHDWSAVAKEVTQSIIDAMLTRMQEFNGDLRLLANHITCTVNRIVESMPKRPIDDFVIYKALSKPLSAYGNEKNSRKMHAHVRVAHWLKDTFFDDPKRNTIIPYIMCKGGIPCHPQQYWMHHPQFAIDYEWYGKKQVKDVANRLCSSVEGLASLLFAPTITESNEGVMVVQDESSMDSMMQMDVEK